MPRRVPRDFRTGLNEEQKETLVEIGRFRTVNVRMCFDSDTAVEKRAFKQDLRNLKARELVTSEGVKHGKSGRQFDVVVLTVRGGEIRGDWSSQTVLGPDRQEIYAGLLSRTKSLTMPGSTECTRLKQRESSKRAAKVRRVVLDYELKRKVFSKLNEEPKREIRNTWKQGANRRRRTQYRKRAYSIPDLRIEFEIREQEIDKVDILVATGDYRFRGSGQAGGRLQDLCLWWPRSLRT